MPYIGKEQVTTLLVPIFLKAMKDPIPNVRFCVAKIIHKMKGMYDAQILNQQIVPILKEMSTDTDKDVQYFSTVALNDL